MEKLLSALRAFTPCNPQEACDQRRLIEALQTRPHVLTRQDESMHITASAWLVNPARTHALMAWHNVYRSWSWLGGHADGDTDLLQVALREVREESGLETVRPITEEIFSVEILTVDGHEKRGEYVGSHLHLNVTYLLEADDCQSLRIRPEENSGVQWFLLDDAVAASTEPWFRERVYAKLNQKLRRFPAVPDSNH